MHASDGSYRHTNQGVIAVNEEPEKVFLCARADNRVDHTSGKRHCRRGGGVHFAFDVPVVDLHLTECTRDETVVAAADGVGLFGRIIDD
nr:hypothetical protein [Tanacetum cinerariifolium]